MRKLTKNFALILTLVICLGMLTGCGSGGMGGNVTLTKSNFEDYFSIQFDPQNARLKKPDSTMSRSLCDLVVKIDSLTNKDLSNVRVELKISIDKGSYHKPNGQDNEFTRTVSIPASGNTDFSITIETWTTFLDVESPKMSDLSYEIISVSGTLS